MCLVPQKVSACTGIEEQPVALLSPFSERQGDGTVREDTMDFTADIFDEPIRFIGKLSSLQYECPESGCVSVAAPVQYLFFRQTVASDIPVALPYAAVQAVISAYIGEFYQASCVYAVTESLQCCLPCGDVQVCDSIGVTTFKKGPVPGGIQPLLSFQSVYKSCIQPDVSSGEPDGEGPARLSLD